MKKTSPPKLETDLKNVKKTKKVSAPKKLDNGDDKKEIPTASLPAEHIAQDASLPLVQITFNEDNPYYHIINQVIDPEAGIGIVDMGLIYDVTEKDGVVQVTMTLTSMGCPAGPQLTTDVDGILRLQDGVTDVEIQVVWEPAWTPDRMNPEIRQMLFGGF